MSKCMMCNKGKLVKKKVSNYFLGTHLGDYNIEVCDKCGEEYYDEKSLAEIESKAKEKGLWGLKERAKIHQVGGSISIIIKKRLADFIGLKPDEEVMIYPESKNKLTVEVVR